MRNYGELINLPTFEERFEYLKIAAKVCEETFGSKRYLNQILYHDDAWKKCRREIIIRDNGCDLGCLGYEIFDKIIVVHHINPITVEDVINRNPKIFDPNNLITVRDSTHKMIHYGTDIPVKATFVERKKNDTCPWKL